MLSKVTARGMVFSSLNFLEGLIFCTNSIAKIYVKKFKINFTVTFLVSILGFQKLFFLLILYANELLLVRSR